MSSNKVLVVWKPNGVYMDRTRENGDMKRVMRRMYYCSEVTKKKGYIETHKGRIYDKYSSHYLFSSFN